MTGKLHNSRIAKNTLMLYIRMFLTMGMYLYTSRIVLNVLGVKDFGIYNVVGGIVILFSFLNSSMTSSTQKFLIFEIGKSDFLKLKEVFSMSLNIHFLIAISIFLLAETIGLWFLNYKLVIPLDRIEAANWVFQFSILSFMVTVMWVPYNALIIAHEKMQVYAIVSIIDVLLKFLSVILLIYIEKDKLIAYSILVFLTSLLVFLVYKLYCNREYKESKYSFLWEKNLFEKMSHFAGWNLFGNLAGIATIQGVNMLLNIFFGPTVNAARAIAFQLSGAVNGFVSNFQVAMNPQIHKSYAVNDIFYMNRLIYVGAKYSFFLLYILILPLLFKTQYILKIWLDIVPDYTVIFCKLLLIMCLLDCISGTLMTSAQATGKIKVYQVVVGGIILFNLPISYLFLSWGYSAYSTLYVSLVLSFLSFIARLILVSRLIDISVNEYLKNVIYKIVIVVVPTYFILYKINNVTSNSMVGLILIILSTIFIVLFFVFFIGTSKTEKIFIKNKIQKLIFSN